MMAKSTAIRASRRKTVNCNKSVKLGEMEMKLYWRIDLKINIKENYRIKAQHKHTKYEFYF